MFDIYMKEAQVIKLTKTGYVAGLNPGPSISSPFKVWIKILNLKLI